LIEGDHGALPFQVQRIFDILAFDGIAQGARQRIVEMVGQEIILCPATNGFLRKSFRNVSAED